ncbi:MAG: hypothetical protein NT029_14270 [Armatimonadetes bacterium]|nr:hypothetical protein [Armatimonadota bacterium]
MILLDEQLMGRGIESAVAEWYPGPVRFIHELRPGTVVRDDAVPFVLDRQNQPTFVTINESDFWCRVAITRAFGVVCVALTDPRATEVPNLLRALFRRSGFRTKAQRMGKVVRISGRGIMYYSADDPLVRAG